MAKTRRKKINHSPLKNQQIQLAVIAPGVLVRTVGLRKEGPQKAGVPKDARPVFVGRVYTGINRGKSYPERGKKRSGHAAV